MLHLKGAELKGRLNFIQLPSFLSQRGTSHVTPAHREPGWVSKSQPWACNPLLSSSTEQLTLLVSNFAGPLSCGSERDNRASLLSKHFSAWEFLPANPPHTYRDVLSPCNATVDTVFFWRYGRVGVRAPLYRNLCSKGTCLWGGRSKLLSLVGQREIHRAKLLWMEGLPADLCCLAEKIIQDLLGWKVTQQIAVICRKII